MPTVQQVLSQYDPNLPQLQQSAESSTQTANDYQSAAYLLPQKLKDAINEKLNYNQDIISEQNKAMSNYFAAPSQAREQYQNIWNPFEREALVNQSTSSAYNSYANLSDILKERRGSISDIINAGTNAFNSAVTAQQGKATMAQQAYQNALGLSQWLYEQQHKTGTGTQISQGVMQQVANEANQGTTLDDIMKRYGTSAYITPDDILRLYNTNSIYGPAQESSEDLQQKYGVSTQAAGVKKPSKWQLKTEKSTGSKILGLQSPWDKPKTTYSLFNPDTGQRLTPDNNGNIHVKKIQTGETGYIPIGEFDATQYEPI